MVQAVVVINTARNHVYQASNLVGIYLSMPKVYISTMSSGMTQPVHALTIVTDVIRL